MDNKHCKTFTFVYSLEQKLATSACQANNYKKYIVHTFCLLFHGAALHISRVLKSTLKNCNKRLKDKIGKDREKESQW